MTDSKQYTESQYKRLYNSLLNDHNNLKIKCVKITNEIKILQNTLKKDDKLVIPETYQRIKDVVNQYFSVDIDVKVRLRHFIMARVVYYRIMRTTTQMNYRQIAYTLPLMQDHATIINCLNNHSDWYEMDKKYKKDFDAIIKILQNEEVQDMSGTI
jgi:chromosomal replication initiation ATPase DnaA